VSEANWLADQNQLAAKAYSDMLSSLEPGNITLDVMRSLPATNTRIANLLRNASITVENVIRGRFTSLVSGLNKRQAAAESKRPIRDRLIHMSMETRLSVFHPLFLRNRTFRLTEASIDAIERGDTNARINALEDARVFCNAEQDLPLKALALAWFTQTLTV
jgi:hypothetical protein